MGRYYSGDINGKFWFGVQSSSDADHFGVTGEMPEYLRYSFTTDDLPRIREGIQNCKEVLGIYELSLRDFFSTRDTYADDSLVEAGIPISMLEYYARLKLGKKILKCVEKEGSCYFEAEL
jgi:hypothetical protein